MLVYTMPMNKPAVSSRSWGSLKLVFAFQIGWIVASVFCILTGRPIEIGLLGVNLIVLFAAVAVELVTRTKLPIALAVNFYVFVTLAAFLGSIVGFYGSVPGWDTYVHGYSGALITWFGFFVVQQAERQAKTQLPKWFAIAAAFAICMGVAALWEVYEYFSDLVLHTNMQVGGLDDTMIDTIAAGVGALIALVIAAWFKAPKSVLPKSLHKS